MNNIINKDINKKNKEFIIVKEINIHKHIHLTNIKPKRTFKLIKLRPLKICLVCGNHKRMNGLHCSVQCKRKHEIHIHNKYLLEQKRIRDKNKWWKF